MDTDCTPDEPFTLTFPAGSVYTAACAATVQGLGPGPGRCLVVGSAPAEAVALRDIGWTVTLIDSRRPPQLPGISTQQANALALPFADQTFEAVSSTCVLCHVGLGRYGDPVAPDGDGQMLRELARVLRPGSLLALMPGPVAVTAHVMGTTHRVYSLTSFEAVIPSSLRWEKIRIFRHVAGYWLSDEEVVSTDPQTPDYLWARFRKRRTN